MIVFFAFPAQLSFKFGAWAEFSVKKVFIFSLGEAKKVFLVRRRGYRKFQTLRFPISLPINNALAILFLRTSRHGELHSQAKYRRVNFDFRDQTNRRDSVILTKKVTSLTEILYRSCVTKSSYLSPPRKLKDFLLRS